MAKRKQIFKVMPYFVPALMESVKTNLVSWDGISMSPYLDALRQDSSFFKKKKFLQFSMKR